MKRFFALALAALPASADLPYASLTGRVTSEEKSVARAAITARCDSLPRSLVTASNDDGVYWLPAIPMGRCDVTFSHAGMQTLTRRVELHAGELSRLDATLQPSAEEESVTSTARERSLFERPIAIWALEQETAEQLPMERGAVGTLQLAPSFGARAGRLDGIVSRRVSRFGVGDAIRETAAVIAFGGDVFLTTRAADELHASLRATYAEDDVLVEATAGGPVGDAVHLFAAGANDAAYGKGSAAIGSRTWLAGSVLDEEESEAAADALFVASDVLHATASVASHDSASLRAFALAGSHQLSFGAVRELGDDTLQLADRWLISPRWIADIAIANGDGDWSSRAGAVFDLARNGRRRLAANVTTSRELDTYEIWYGEQLEANGYARAGLIRTSDDTHAFAIDAAFRFLVLTFGGSATFANHAPNRANLWVLFDAPLLDRDFDVGLVGRHLTGDTMLDAAVTASFTAGRFAPFAKGEVLNAFESGPEQRSWRIGVGARL